MTEKIFYQDSYCSRFTAKVLSCETYGDEYKVVLNRTAFFPEGGGQTADTGILKWTTKDGQEKQVKVSDAQEKAGIVYHMTDGAVAEGCVIEGVLDYEERFSKMQQHTGEHIISGLVNKYFGYRNVGFHLGSEIVTMDYDGVLTEEDLRKIEWESNEAVAKNLPVEVLYPTEEELKEIAYRSKIEIEGQVRIVRIPGYDVCACCAPHVKETGSVGLIKLTNAIHYKGGMRVSMVCGFRALLDYNKKEKSVVTISQKLSAKQEEIVEAVERLEQEIAEKKEKISRLTELRLEEKLLKIKKDVPYTVLFEDELDAIAMRKFVNGAMEQTDGICAVFVGTEPSYRYVLGCKGKNVQTIVKALNGAFGGKGGGRPPMVQGFLTGERKEIETFICNLGESFS